MTNDTFVSTHFGTKSRERGAHLSKFLGVHRVAGEIEELFAARIANPIGSHDVLSLVDSVVAHDRFERRNEIAARMHRVLVEILAALRKNSLHHIGGGKPRHNEVGGGKGVMGTSGRTG